MRETEDGVGPTEGTAVTVVGSTKEVDVYIFGEYAEVGDGCNLVTV